MELLTPRLRLREYRETDLLVLRNMDSFPEMQTYERELPHESITPQSLNEYLHNQLEKPRSTYQFVITALPNDVVRGLLKFTRLNDTIREWEIGWAIHPEDWGKGYATEAARCVMDWAFMELGVHRVVAFCHVNNLASVRVMNKLEMHQDGRLSEVRWLNGEWWDEYIYAILDREWQIKRGKVY